MICVNFQAFKNSYPQERSGKHEKNLKLKVSVSEKKKISALIQNTEIGTLGVLVPDTEAWFLFKEFCNRGRGLSA